MFGLGLPELIVLGLIGSLVVVAVVVVLVVVLAVNKSGTAGDDGLAKDDERREP